MNKTITIVFEDGRPLECEAGTTAGALAPDPGAGLPFVACLVNNDVRSLAYPLDVNCSLRFLTMADSRGMRVYRNSLTFILAKAAFDLFPKAEYTLQHSLGAGYFCSLDMPGASSLPENAVRRLQSRMRELIRQDMPIERHRISFADAMSLFEKHGMPDKLNLLRFHNPPKIVLYKCGDYFDVSHGPLAPSTGVLDRFALSRYPPGFAIRFPEPEKNCRLTPLEKQPCLFRVFQEHKRWGKIVGVSTAGTLNELIAEKRFDEFIRVAEAFHEKKIAQIADRIADARGRIRLALISGPSAAGKTTFTKRLSVQLQANGLRPLAISLDDYYVNDEDTPRAPDGRPDYEHIESLDLKLLNHDLAALIRGREIELPFFNFRRKRREYRGKRMSLGPDRILLLEGIHGLNPRLSAHVPEDRKFKIYVSALTQLNIDRHNRISTTDNRLMRRLVRDHAFRGNSALATLRMWPKVRAGEKKWVFPFQPLADAMFNSALDYELAVLKPMVAPLLPGVKPMDPEYAEAQRLREFLYYFLEAPSLAVPGTSILREYIGSSGFEY